MCFFWRINNKYSKRPFQYVASDKKKLFFALALRLVAAVVVIGLVLFLPAGSLEYWEGWIYCSVIFIPMLFVFFYFLKNDPEFLERRMKMKEKERKQGLIIWLSSLVFFVGFLLPGFDYRFGWSEVPVPVVLAANAIVFLGYALVFLVFRENHYASRVVQVEKGQKVVSTGPYSVVRHPMYVGTLAMFLATPIALGSYYAFLVFMLLPPFIYFRILNEEEVLRKELPGYAEYCGKVRYRLVPFVW